MLDTKEALAILNALPERIQYEKVCKSALSRYERIKNAKHTTTSAELKARNEAADLMEAAHKKLEDVQMAWLERASGTDREELKKSCIEYALAHGLSVSHLVN